MSKRPWGNYRVLLREPGIQVKRIEIHPHSRFSLQKHLKRAEKWTILSGVGVATVASRRIKLKAGTTLEVAKGQVHRMENTGRKPLVVIEVQFGHYLGEDDIIRLADDFGRS